MIQLGALALLAIMLFGIGWWLHTIVVACRPYWTPIAAFILGYLAHHIVVNGVPSVSLNAHTTKVFRLIIITLYYVLAAIFTFGLAYTAYGLLVPYWKPILWVASFFTTWWIFGVIVTCRPWERKRS